MTRRPNIGSAASDLGFALLALVAGWVGLSPIFPVMVFACAIASWGWTRRRPLMAMRTRITQGAIAVAMIAIVLALAYWIGLGLGGHARELSPD